ncbi:hypothetical protein RYX36_010399 [Vicia faba]
MRILDNDDRLPRRHGKSVQLMEVEDVGASTSASHPPQEPEEYTGGPSSTSLLVRYEQHCARRLWFREERGFKKELKCVAHGLKLQGWV